MWHRFAEGGATDEGVNAWLDSELSGRSLADENGGDKVCHGSGGVILLRPARTYCPPRRKPWRARLTAAGNDERAPVEDIVGAGRSPAQRLLDLYHGPWAGDLTRLFRECSF